MRSAVSLTRLKSKRTLCGWMPTVTLTLSLPLDSHPTAGFQMKEAPGGVSSVMTATRRKTDVGDATE